LKEKLILGLFLGAGVLLAQHPGGGAPMSTPASAQPGMNNPNNPLNGGNMPSSTTAKVDDKRFAQEAAMGGMMQIQAAKLAEQQSSNASVKQYAQKMIDDHTKADDQLQQVASKDSLTLPDKLDVKQQGTLDKLAKLTGPAFDKAYAKDMVKDHERDINAFRAESESGANPDVKQFAAQTLPVLEQHLDSAKTLEKSVKKGQ
jgi:putative membrane protein